MIPPDAFEEYGFREGETAILMSGSKTSGGFGLTTLRRLKDSPLFDFLKPFTGLPEHRIPEGEAFEIQAKTYCRIKIIHQSIWVPVATLKKYGVQVGNPLLTVRGSGMALGFITRGPIVEEAMRHPELVVFE